MSVDNDGLALAGQRFSNALSLDQNLETNASASSGFNRHLWFNVRHCATRRSVTDLPVLSTDPEKSTPERRMCL